MTPEWRLAAACTRHSELPWISDPAGQEAIMAAVCSCCVVFSTCRLYVDEHQVTSGFWAGQSR